MQEEFFTNDFSKPHHRKAVAALIVAVLIFGGILAVYFLRPAPVVAPVDPSLQKQRILSEPNPVDSLDKIEVTSRQNNLTAPNPTAKLTADQVDNKKSQLNNI